MAYRLTKIQKIILKNENNLLSACEEANISDIVIKRLVNYYIHHKTINEIAEEEYVEPSSIKQCFRRAKRKLNI